jgi:pyruvate kinase
MPVMLDTKGPEIRTGDFVGGQAQIETNMTVRISMTPLLGTAEKFSVTYDKLYDDVQIGERIKLDDGNLTLVVTDKDEEKRELITNALNHDLIKDKRGVNCPDSIINLPYISEKDYNDLVWGTKNHISLIAASFVRSAEDVLAIRKILRDNKREDIRIIAKIENPLAVKNIDEIIKVVDGIMVARGDLGVEVPAENVPVIQRELIEKCRVAGKPCITATQMLDSMKSNPNPTRAEVSDVANAVLEGTDAVMLSAESASGEYPVEACSMQAKIAAKIEDYLPYEKLAKEAFDTSIKNNNDAISNSVANTALLIGAKLIVCLTESEETIKRISKARPICPILSVSNDMNICKTSCLEWGVYPMYIPYIPQFIEEMEVYALLKARELNIPEGSPIILTGGTPTGTNKINFMKIITVNGFKEVDL